MSYRHDASPQALDRLAVLIPAWQPEERLLTLATSLLDRGFRKRCCRTRAFAFSTTR
jgi:hypothetical protein